MNGSAALKKIAQTLKNSEKVAIISHISPDGDCVGSAVGLGIALRDCLGGKDVVLVCSDPIPERLRFLLSPPDVRPFDYIAPTSADMLPRDALFVSLDVASRERLGSVAELLPHGVDIKIDHHAEGKNFAPLEYVDGKAAATGEIIYALLGLLFESKKNAAKAIPPLYAAIVFDSSSFRTSNTTPKTLLVASKMLRSAPSSGFFSRGFDRRDAADVIAASAALSSMRLLFDGRVSFMLVTVDLMRTHNVCENDFGAAVGIAREISGVSLAVTVKQTSADPTLFRVSTRSDERFDCAAFCAALGGGGHLRAAGASITAPSPASAAERILDEIGRRIIV